jgi:hypothetical protein
VADVGIVGAGTAGLHLALLLQQRGLEPTLYAERTANEVRAGRIPNTVVHNHRTRARERELGVNHWDESSVPIAGHWHCLPGPPEFPGFFASPSLSVDYRLYQARLLEDFEARGGTVVVGAVGADDLPRLSGRHDLIAVSTGRGGFGRLFPPLPGRSPFDAPARLLSAGLYTGVAPATDTHYVTLAILPGHGEVIQIPMESFDGLVCVLLFECLPGGDLEVLARTPYEDDPKGYGRTVLEKLRVHCPSIFARVDPAAFALTGPGSILQGAVTPTARASYASLDGGKVAIALGDAHVAMDPVVGLGANSASLAAWILGEAIAEGGPFDEAFCRRVDEQRLPAVMAHFDFTNFMLAPEPQLLDVLGAMSQNPALANDFTDNFTVPARQLEHLASPDAAAAYIASFA